MIRWILVLWPSFLVAGVAETLFFTLINPRELYLFGNVVEFSPIATYSIGFFGFWALCAASSLLTLYLIERPGSARSDVPASKPKPGARVKPAREAQLHAGHRPAHG
jgi:hypothetical protein